MKFGRICSPNMNISKNGLFYIRLFCILIFILAMGTTQKKPIILTIEKEGNPIPQSISLALLVLANEEITQVYIDTSLNGLQLKEQIYAQVTQLLTPKEMMLQINEKRIKEGQEMCSLLTFKDVIIQKKIPLNEVSKIEFHSNIEDEISLQKGVAKMPCGHMMGRLSLISLLHCVVSQKQWEIKCPHQGCDRVWDYTLCRKMATLTKQQDKHFTTQFSNNWLENFTKKCPKCGLPIQKMNMECNKVKCSSSKCKSSYFCFLCLNPWKSKRYEHCGNDECNITKYLPQLMEMKEIVLVQRQAEEDESYNAEVDMVVEVPVMRLCPNCNLPIQHVSGCKHMKCYNCKTQFCWVCLSIFKREWPCGSFNEYCGKVAPIQKQK